MPAARTTAPATRDEDTDRAADDTIVGRAAGLTPAQRAELLAELERLDASPDTAIQERDLTPREVVLGGFLRERDHLDGCPLIAGGDRLLAAFTEAYDQRIVTSPGQAPSATASRLGLKSGDHITHVRCLKCGGDRYGAGRVSDVIRAELGRTADPDPDRSL